MIRTHKHRIPLYLYTLYLAFVLLSCNEKDKPLVIPPTVLGKEKMAHMLADVHLAQAQANSNVPTDSALTTPINFQDIFVKDSITKQQYEESMSFYLDHPQLLDTVYTQVLNELSKMQGATK